MKNLAFPFGQKHIYFDFYLNLQSIPDRIRLTHNKLSVVINFRYVLFLTQIHRIFRLENWVGIAEAVVGNCNELVPPETVTSSESFRAIE